MSKRKQEIKPEPEELKEEVEEPNEEVEEPNEEEDQVSEGDEAKAEEDQEPANDVEEQEADPEPEEKEEFDEADKTLAVNKSVSFVDDSEMQESPEKKKKSKGVLKGSGLNQDSIPNPILSANKPPKPKLPKEYELFDFIFPGGKLSKLCKVKSESKTTGKIPEILEAFKFKDPHPCLILSGARDSQRGKLLAGVARAAFRSDAVIIDSGVATGIENYCLRRSMNYFLF